MLEWITIAELSSKNMRHKELRGITMTCATVHDRRDFLCVQTQLDGHRQDFSNSRAVDIEQQLIDEFRQLNGSCRPPHRRAVTETPDRIRPRRGDPPVASI